MSSVRLAPSLRRVQIHFISLKVWKFRECARAIMCDLGLKAFNDEVFHLVRETYRAWQLVRFCRFEPYKALSLLSIVRYYCLAPGDRATSEVILHPPPFGYNGCLGCWKSLDDAQKRRAWLPFWIAIGQVKITESGGGGGGATDDDPVAGAEPGKCP